MFISVTNYGFDIGDDAASWFYQHSFNLPESDKKLLDKGRKDLSTVAEVSVTIKYSPQFAKTVLGSPIYKGIYIVAIWTMMV